jgi:hypothetical protein
VTGQREHVGGVEAHPPPGRDAPIGQRVHRPPIDRCVREELVEGEGAVLAAGEAVDDPIDLVHSEERTMKRSEMQ